MIRPFCRRPLTACPVIILTGIVISFCMIADRSLAQLTPGDLVQLQERARVEGWTFDVGENAATQYSLEELCGMVEPEDWRDGADFDPMVEAMTVELPATFDWRALDGVTPVRNQGGCGSCWAFSTVGALECNIRIAEGVSVDLSEQWLLRCNRNGWDCGGGWFAHDYHEWKPGLDDSTGAVLESDYPYTATDGPCGGPDPHPYLIEDWMYIGTSSGVPSVQAMKQAIVEYGPISVCVYAGPAMQAYNGGVFNVNEQGTINHAVVLVGWDDNQGPAGVWFMRNSWGPGWGEGGYMLIPYGYSSIGYAANYIEYKPVHVEAVNTFGPTPLLVDFTSDVPGVQIDSCEWDFGDGSGSTMQNCSHEYTQPGHFNVQFTASTSDGVRTKTLPGLVSAYADTMRADVSGGLPDQIVRVDIFVRNFVPLTEMIIPICWEGPYTLSFDSISTAGLRTEFFEVQNILNFDISHYRLTVTMKASSDGSSSLSPGAAPVLSVFFRGSMAVPPEAYDISMAGYAVFLPKFVTYAGEYAPVLVDAISGGSACCTGTTGNVDNDPLGTVDIGDLTGLINFLFITLEEPECLDAANVDGLGSVDIGDVTKLIDYLFISYDPLADCL
ncbi:MAG: PKD domain-containing protein [Candidatus Zixiibacteriota bacterium]|nr:MAG: PKD domain-containing protein [candidate division Zixibacteria bacterium]